MREALEALLIVAFWLGLFGVAVLCRIVRLQPERMRNVMTVLAVTLYAAIFFWLFGRL